MPGEDRNESVFHPDRLVQRFEHGAERCLRSWNERMAMLGLRLGT